MTSSTPTTPPSISDFYAVPLHRLLGIRPVVREPGFVVVEMPVAQPAMNLSGNLHGGAIATLIDVASGMATARGAQWDPATSTIVTADLHVRYLARPRGDIVRAEARVLRSGRQLIIVQCHVLDEEDRLIAAADFSTMIVPLRRPLPAAQAQMNGHGSTS
jgi:uncharacterized protein (TIGR00369 family)